MDNNNSGQETNRINTPTVDQIDSLELSLPTISAERNPRNLFFTCFLFFALIILNLENKFESSGSIITTNSTVSSSAFYFGKFRMSSGLMNDNEKTHNRDSLYTVFGSIPIIHGSSRWQFDWTKSSNASKSAWVSLFIQLDKNGKTYNWSFEKMISTDNSNIVFEGKTTEVPTDQILNTNFSGCLLEIDLSHDTNLINQIFPQKENGSYRFRGNIVNEKGQRTDKVEYLIKSVNCNFEVLLTGSSFSMSLFRINIIHFSFLYNLKVLMEIRGSVTQLLHSNSPIFGPNHVSNTSISCLIMQIILDLLESIFILYCSFTLPSLLFSSFTLMILFKLIHIFYIQVRYIFWIWKSNYLQNIPVNEIPEVASQFYRRLYLFLFGMILFFIFLFIICDSGEIFSTTSVSNQKNKTFTRSIPYCIYLSLFFFLVPQIVNDTFANLSNSSNLLLPLHPHFILTSLFGKAFVPIYIWGYSNSIFNAPIFIHLSNMPISTKNSPLMSIFILLIVSIQAILYFFQLKFGTKSLIPKIFRPKPYNYFRLTNKDIYSEILTENTAEVDINIVNDVMTDEYLNDKETNHTQDDVQNIQSSGLDEIQLTGFHNNRRYNNFCVICMVNISIFDDFDHELCAVCTPCDHIFHQKCLKKWMNVKLECPTCRRSIPPFDIKR